MSCSVLFTCVLKRCLDIYQRIPVLFSQDLRIHDRLSKWEKKRTERMRRRKKLEPS